MTMLDNINLYPEACVAYCLVILDVGQALEGGGYAYTLLSLQDTPLSSRG